MMRLARSIPLHIWLMGLVIVIVPVGAGALAFSNQFDGLYGQDAYAYYDYGVNALAEQLYPPPPFFWPPGYPLFIFGLSIVIGETPLAGQLISVIAGALTVAGVMLLAYEVVDRDKYTTAIIAGLVMAVGGQLWQSSIVLMADTLSLATVTLGVWALVRWARRARHAEAAASFWLVLAAGLVAYATITRWVYGLVAMVCFVYAIVVLLHIGKISRRNALRHTLFAAISTAVVLSPVILPILTQSETTFGGNFELQFTNINLVNAFRRDFSAQEGYLSYSLPNGLYYSALLARPFYFTPVLALFGMGGLILVFRTGQLWRFFPLWGWMVIVLLFLISLPQQNVRFGLSYAPPFAVFIAIGVVIVLRWTEEIRFLRNIVGLSVIIGVSWALVTAVNWSDDFIQRKNANLATVQWVENHLPQDAQIITFGLTLTLQHYTPYQTYEIYYLSPDEVLQLAEQPSPTYLLLDLYNVETQWRGQSPSENYQVLSNHYALIEIGKHRAYTLFEVKTS